MPNPNKPWLRLWDCTLDLPKAQRLTGDQFKGWINLLMLANRQNDRGRLPSAPEIAFALRTKESAVKPLVDALVKAKLVDRSGEELTMHDWATWQPPEKTSAQRAREWRESQKNQALEPSAHRALEPSAPEERREEREEEKSETPSAHTPDISLGPEYTTVGHLAMQMGADVSWATWVSRQGQIGHPAWWIEHALKHCPSGKFNQDYVAGMLRGYQRNSGPPKEQTNGHAQKPVPTAGPVGDPAERAKFEALGRRRRTEPK
jgi:hypothetical protein